MSGWSRRLRRLEHEARQRKALQADQPGTLDYLLPLLEKLNRTATALVERPLESLKDASPATRMVRTAMDCGDVGSEPYYTSLREQLVVFLAEQRAKHAEVGQ
jgi:hypothetical protein